MIEGTRAVTLSNSRGTTLLVFLPHRFQSSTRRRHPIYSFVAPVERPLIPVTVLRGNHPPVPTCSQNSLSLQNFLRPAAHERVLRRRIRSELSPFIGSLSVTCLILCSLNASQSLYAF